MTIRKILVTGASMVALGGAGAPSEDLKLGQLARLGTVDERYQAYNVEMVCSPSAPMAQI